MRGDFRDVLILHLIEPAGFDLRGDQFRRGPVPLRIRERHYDAEDLVVLAGQQGVPGVIL
jgi:hypothetical protein